MRGLVGDDDRIAVDRGTDLLDDPRLSVPNERGRLGITLGAQNDGLPLGSSLRDGGLRLAIGLRDPHGRLCVGLNLLLLALIADLYDRILRPDSIILAWTAASTEAWKLAL